MTKHCCEGMTDRVETRCDQHPNPFDCADNLVYYSDEPPEYGLIVHDGGTSFIAIAFCPWCGARLPEPPEDD